MKKFLIILLCIFCISPAFASKSESCIWSCINNEDWQLAHKQIMVYPWESEDDQLIQYLLMAYLHHRMGNEKEMQAIINFIDNL